MTGLALWIIFVVLSLGDIGLSAELLDRPGKREGNPVMRWLMSRFGVIGALVIFKGALVIALGAAIFWRGPYIHWVAAPLDVVMVWVVIHNARQVKR